MTDKLDNLETAAHPENLRRVAIDPVSRVEGHGKVTLLLDENDRVHQVRLHIVEFRGFEKFIQGRPYWEAPVMVQRLCGICPVSHHLAASKAMHEEALAALEAQPRPDSVEMASQMGNVAVVRTNLGEHAAAAAMLARQVAVYRAHFGPDNARLARALNNLGSAYHANEEPDQALGAATEAVAVFRRAVPASSPELAGALSNLAPVLMARGRHAEAEAALREALAIFDASVGPTHMRTLSARLKLGQAQHAQRQAAAPTTLQSVLADIDRHAPEGHPIRAHGRIALARWLIGADRPAEAVPLLRAAVDLREASLADGHPDRAVARSLLGDALRRTGQTREAAPLLRTAHGDLAQALGADHADTREAAERLSALPK